MVGIVFNPTKYNVKHKPGNGCPGTKNHFYVRLYSDEPDLSESACFLSSQFTSCDANKWLKSANPKSRTRNFMPHWTSLSTIFIQGTCECRDEMGTLRVENFFDKSSISALFENISDQTVHITTC